MTVQIDPRVIRLAERLVPLVAEEARMLQARAAHLAKAERADSEIMRACAAVGEASDAIAQAKFAGASELPARRKLEQAARHLASVMRKHGRGPA